MRKTLLLLLPWIVSCQQSNPEENAVSSPAPPPSMALAPIRGQVRLDQTLAQLESELAAAIRDWPSQYHLDAARANLLRPIAPASGATVLEIGAGCGAITRFLGETGATVLALEGSLARARIAASRCRDLDNVVAGFEEDDRARNRQQRECKRWDARGNRNHG